MMKSAISGQAIFDEVFVIVPVIHQIKIWITEIFQICSTKCISVLFCKFMACTHHHCPPPKWGGGKSFGKNMLGRVRKLLLGRQFFPEVTRESLRKINKCVILV